MKRKDPERMLAPKIEARGLPPSYAAYKASRHEGKTSGMPCPSCEAGTFTIDSRVRPGGVRRRRCCGDCGHRFTTWEVAGDNPLVPQISLQTIAHELRQLTERFERLAEMSSETDRDEDAA